MRSAAIMFIIVDMNWLFTSTTDSPALVNRRSTWYEEPLLDALTCVDEKSPVRIATTTPGRLMVKGVKNGTEITFELFCVEVVQETSSDMEVMANAYTRS
jgi:hypothetical protein